MNYQEGSIIQYKAFDGEIREIVVSSKEKDIKNGRPGFDGRKVNSDPKDQFAGVWGYDSQITAVVKF